ncbi:MAG: response regulator [Rhodospirillales bacterium]|nr:response regulator [Rhodospirillales bacterium]
MDAHPNVLLESARAALLIGVTVFAWFVGRHNRLGDGRGWRLVVAGFGLVAFGAALDLTDNFPALARFMVVGPTPAKDLIERVVGYIGGNTLLFIGLVSTLRSTIRLREGEKRFQSVAAVAADAIITIDEHSIVLTWNPGAERMFGYTAQEMVGQPLLTIMPDRYRARHAEGLARAVRTGVSLLDGKAAQLHGLRKDGSEFPVELTVSSWRSEEGRLFLGIVRDVSERLRVEEEAMRRAREEAEAGVRAKSTFLAMMSHEIRTPMSGIIGMVHLLGESRLDPDQREWVDTIGSSAESLLSILNDVLDFSKLEADRVELERVPFDLSRVIADVKALTAGRAAEKGLSLEIRLHEDLPHHLVGDPTRLRQVLLNLASNAVKFTERGGIVIAAVPVERHGQALVVRFSVADTGIGMTEEVRTQLFTEFTQADATIARRYGGTGLGLAICKRIIGLMDGTIGVDSAPGAGSTFWFTVAFETAGPLAATVSRHFQPTAIPRLPRLRILLAEDNAINQKVVTTLLGRQGHEVTVVEDGRKAVQAVRDGTFDLVLMDMQMPEMDGLAATRAIRDLGGRLSELPIIALTANAMAGDEMRCLAAGMNDYVSKPIRPEALSAALARNVRGEGLPSDDDAVDAGQLRAMTDALGDEETQALLREFLADAARKVEALATAPSASLDQIRALAHDLKSTAGNFGFRRLSQAAAAVERACHDENPAAVGLLVGQLEPAFSEAARHLERSLAAPPTTVGGA